MKKPYHLFLFLIIIYSCQATYLAKPHDFPNPVDTTDRPVEFQDKKVYTTPQTVSADNFFDGARLNDFQHLNQDTFQVAIFPENIPINPSPYYAFRLWSETPQQVVIKLAYANGAAHRYPPKISQDGKNWTLVDSTLVVTRREKDSIAYIRLDISPDKLWIAAQELQNSTHVKDWCLAQAKKAGVAFKVAGKSKQGRDMLLLDITQGDNRKKDIIAIISRQHPPEVTGYLAMK